MPPIAIPTVDTKAKNKKIIFDDEGEVVASEKRKEIIENEESGAKTEEVEEDYFEKREKQRLNLQHETQNIAQKKWFNVYRQFPTITEDVMDMKDNEQMELYNVCKSAFDGELPAFNKGNPSDVRWLQTALHKGTAKDRANAGALLVTSNPLANLEALATLIGYTKLSNKSCTDVISILTDLWKEVLLPPQRKLLSLQMRGADWKVVRKDATLSKDQQRRIYAYWYFENELKEHYFEFLKNLQQSIQGGQENNKNTAVVAAAQLLAFAPEKEQMLLTMIVNKLGDPIAKIASKALHHLTEVAHKHPNMCGVIVTETEKLLFRNNISERAQHFALCFLASVAPSGRPEVCTKLVNICFALFKVLVQKGAVNNRTMQAILRCLQKAILDAKPAAGNTEILTKEMQDTVYRLVHLADIRVSVQTLGLLLQLISVKTEKSDRFYNALYKKMLDLEMTNIGAKTAAQLLHIIHRAVHIDANVQRAQAFIKRLLQLSLYMPPQMTAGCLIVIHKLLRSRKDLVDGGISASQAVATVPKVQAEDEELAKFDSDGEEKYEDVRDADETSTNVNGEQKPFAASSWHHATVATNAATTNVKVRDMSASKYDPFHRVPTFAGAEFALRNELLLLREHFHPTVQVFADNILNQKRIEYYGDPLRDFALPHFLERFAFKNPKKLDNQKAEAPTIAHKRYIAFGARGKPVKSLTKVNCTEDERFIFNFLEQKRKQAVVVSKTKAHDETVDEDEAETKAVEVDDNEFDDYLDGFFGKKAKAAADNADNSEDDDEELDFLKELGGELKGDVKSQKKKKRVVNDDEDDEAEDDIDADWGVDDNNIADEQFAPDDSDMSEDEAGSIDLDDDVDEEDEEEDIENSSATENSDLEDDDVDDIDSAPTKAKRARKTQHAELDSRSFAKKLKHSDDMSSLFAAADDFAELLEETGKLKGQGTANAIFNKDKSSDKQMKWEEKRRSNSKVYTKKSSVKFAKKRKN